MKSITRIAAASALLALGSTAAQASIIAPSTPGGSEVILSLVNVTTNDSISIDLGKQIGELVIGDSFALSTDVQGFISDAGGLSGVQYGIVAGDASDPSPLADRTFLTSSTEDLTVKSVANATNGTWGNSILQLVNNLNSGDASGPEVNNTYGPFDDTGSPNYVAGGHFNWQTGDAQLNTLALGTEEQGLFIYQLGGFAGSEFGQSVLAPVILSEDSLSIVPIPAAVWLFGSALLGLFGSARRSQIADFVRSRFSLRHVDLMA